MIHKLISFLTFSILTLSATAQNKTFTVAAMNVDGMPKSIKVAGIYTITLNPDAKEAAGATAIGQKLVGKGYDLIGVSEDFNYNDQILEQIGSTYSSGTHRGKISASISAMANYLAKKPLFDTDGLNFFWRTGNVEAKYESCTAWWDHYGYTEDGADGLIKKGFRYYMADFGDGVLVDVYILHMDAETSDGDLAARESQMRQLTDDILNNPSMRPKIVMGDTNCRYTRDRLKQLFIDAIDADPRYTIHDCWIEKNKSNTYPAYGSNALMVDALGYEQGEIVDKIFYINPKYGLQLQLSKFFVDTDFNNESGEPLADHYPVVGTFKTKGILYDPASYWDGSYQTNEYSEYAQEYNNLLPMTVPTLRSPFKETLAALLTEHVGPGNDIVQRMKNFRTDFNSYMSENFNEKDITADKIINPSFEEGVPLQSGNVSGWVVPSDVYEAFISGVIDNVEGAAIRNFEPHDGNYIFNTWGGYPDNGFYCHQDIKLARGWYSLSAVVATDGNNVVGLRFGDSCIPSEPQEDRTIGQLVKGFFYHSGGTVTIGAESNGWFEADDFRLYQLVSIPTSIESLETNTLSQKPNLSQVTIYSSDGRQMSSIRRGLNIIHYPDGRIQKLIVR